MKRALIFGVSGQDGAYLSQTLLSQGYEVHGTSRDKDISGFGNLTRLGIKEQVTLHSAALVDFRSVLQVISDTRPDEIYNLAGQSSVGLSFQTPIETIDGIVVGTLNILESIRFLKRDIRFYNAGSSEAFGSTDAPASEETPFHPRSPYGVAKAAAHWAVVNYREAYGLFGCSGILFNHESPLRPDRFVTQKIIRGALDIATGQATELSLGNVSIARDWGWAPEYCEAMALMLKQDAPRDIVIATGRTSKLEDFVARAFSRLGLDWREHVRHDSAFERPSDLAYSCGDPSRAADQLGWRASVGMPEIVDLLMDAEIARRPRLTQETLAI